MKIIVALAVIIGSALLWNYAKPDKIQKTIESITEQVAPKKITPQTQKREYIFVPYWSFTKNIVADSENSLIYFGLGVNEGGLELEDDGYEKLEDFVDFTPNASERIMAVRMTDKNVNAQILKDPLIQEKIASTASKLAKEYEFDGVLLDYETSAFGFESTMSNILSFYELFADEVKSEDLLFYVALYGDNYFRARPYDIEKIGEFSDRVIIMAYDFSKSRGNPGPNFPLYDDSGIYGYDLATMVDDFQKDVDNEKIVVAFGYFGYDWEIDKDGISTSNGAPLSTNEINKSYVNDCELDECVLDRSKESLEPSVFYKDSEGNDHVVWFEDAESVEKKKEELKKKGILETASWAYSYY